MPWYKNPSHWLKALVALYLLLLAWQFSPLVSTNGDNASYLIGAKSLIEGKGYRSLQIPGAPVQTTFPPLTSFYLAVFLALGKTPLLPKIAMGILGSLTLVLSYYYLRTLVGGLVLWSVLILMAFSSFLIEYSQVTMSEVPFIAASLLALWLYEKSWEDPGNRKLFVLAQAAALLPFYARTVGLALVIALIAASLIRKRYRHAVATAVIFLVTLSIYKKFWGGGSAYTEILFMKNLYDPEAGTVTSSDLVARFIKNFHQYRQMFNPLLFFPLFPWYSAGTQSVLSAGLFLLQVAGLGWLVRRRRLAPVLFLLFYFAIILVYVDIGGSERYSGGVLPLLYAVTFLGLYWILSWVSQAVTGPARRYALPVGLLGFLGCLLIVNFSYAQKKAGDVPEYTADWGNYYSCADWIRENTPDSAVVMCRKDNLLYLRSNRKAFVYPYSHNVENIYRAIDSCKADYVVYDGFYWTQTSLKYLYPAIINRPAKFKLVYYLQNPDTYVLQVVK